MASILRDIVENDKRYIATFEDPIEFDLLSIPNAQSPIVQGEIRRHLLDFTKVPKNVSRRAVDVCFIGEARDIETLEGMLIAAEMGMAVYCTVHTLNVAETIDRIVSIFPSNQRNFITTLLVNQLRVVIQQRLLPKVGGGRIAIREFLKFEKKHKTALLHTEPEKISLVLQDFVNKDGISLERAAKARLDEGLITEETYYSIKKEQE